MGTLGKQLESEEAKKKSEKSIRDEIGGRDVEWIEKLVAKMKSNLLKTGSAARSPETKELSKFVSSVCERMLAERIQQGIDDGLKIASLTTTTSDRKASYKNIQADHRKVVYKYFNKLEEVQQEVVKERSISTPLLTQYQCVVEKLRLLDDSIMGPKELLELERNRFNQMAVA